MNDGLDQLRLMMASPLIAAVLVLPFFALVTAVRGHSWTPAFHHFLNTLKWPVGVCVGIAFAYVMVWTLINNAGNGPLSFIFFAPMAVASGIVIGTIIWFFLPMKPNSTVERDAHKSDARPSP
jgi:hypothetical protein